jgi:PilZ domain
MPLCGKMSVLLGWDLQDLPFSADRKASYRKAGRDAPVQPALFQGGTPMHSLSINGEIVIPSIPEGIERRRRPRQLCEAMAVAAVVRPELLFRGTIRNISEGGCYFETQARLSLEPSTEVRLRFKLSDRRYTTLARVRNMVPGRGMGLEFAFTNGKAEQSIQSLIRALDASKLAKSL